MSCRSIGRRRRRAARRTIFGVLAAALAALALSTCDTNDPTAPCPPPALGYGVLQGQVRVAGQPLSIDLGARRVFYPYTLVATTRSDADGRYRLPVPRGTYRIELNPETYSHGLSVRDTVTVGAGVRSVDLLGGKLTVHIDTPHAMDGSPFRCDLEGPNPSTAGWATAREGQLEFVFPIVALGNHRLQLRNNDDSKVWLPGTRNPGAADLVSISATRPTEYRTAFRNHASLSGTIQGSWREADTSPPEIHAYTLDREFIGGTRAWWEGMFRIELLVDEPVRLEVSNRGIDQWIGGDSFETATTFQLPSGRTREGISFAEGGILCRLVGPGSLANYNARVVLRSESGHEYSLRSENANTVRICNLTPGRYRFYIHGDCDWDGEPWASQWYDRVDSLAAATPVEVVAGRLTTVTVTLDEDGRIEGRILERTGRPGPHYIAIYRGGQPLCDYPTASVDSSFSVRGLGNGDYTLAVLVDGSPWWYPGTAFPDSARQLRIRNHSTLSGIEWQLPKLDAKGSP